MGFGDTLHCDVQGCESPVTTTHMETILDEGANAPRLGHSVNYCAEHEADREAGKIALPWQEKS